MITITDIIDWAERLKKRLQFTYGIFSYLKVWFYLESLKQ